MCVCVGVLSNPNPEQEQCVCVFVLNDELSQTWIEKHGELLNVREIISGLSQRCAHVLNRLLFHHQSLRFHSRELESISGVVVVVLFFLESSRNEPPWHFINALVVGAMGLDGVDVNTMQVNTARNVGGGRTIKTSTADFFASRNRVAIWTRCKTSSTVSPSMLLKCRLLFPVKVRLLQLKFSQRPGLRAVDQSNKFCSSSKQAPS